MPAEKARGRTILTVDDDASVRATIVAWIEDSGHIPLQAASGVEGLELLAAHAPDLVLLDLRMPVMNGLGFLERKRELSDETPVIIVSGRADIQDAILAFRLGAWDYLTKPIENFDLLAHAVNAVLERRDLARQVRQAQARYADLVRDIPLVIFCMDAGLRLSFVNNACQAMLGFSPEQACEKPGWLLERTHPEDRPRLERALRQRLADNGYAFSLACRLLHASGRTVHGVVKSIAHTGAAPDADLEGVILDITDRKLLEEFLVQKEKVKTLGAVSAEVAHEIRNPLVSIAGYARRLVKAHPELEDARVILEQARRLEQLLDRIRDSLDPVLVKRQPCVLADVARSSLAMLAPELDANGVSPRLELDANGASVEGDPDLLAQVAVNLIRATLTALPPRGAMWVRTFCAEGLATLEVGGQQAQPVEDAERVFLPFDAGGDTIGLPSCYRLARAMGGSLTFEQKDGRGWFTLALPGCGEGGQG